jgi:ferredoxin
MVGLRKSASADLPLQIRREITGELKRIICERSFGLSLVGIASVDRFAGAPKGHGPRDFIPDANAVIVIGLPIIDGVADHDGYFSESEIVKDEDFYVGNDGVKRVYYPRLTLRNQINARAGHESLNMEIQILSIYAGAYLESQGYKTLSVPTTYGTTFSWPSNLYGSGKADFPVNVNGFGPFSHRHAAVAAGLGEFGLNNLLLTPQWGPRIRLTTVITRAPLTPDTLLAERVCMGEKCSLCVKNCPGGALGDIIECEIAGKVNIKARHDFIKCEQTYGSCMKKCISSCPVGAFS